MSSIKLNTTNGSVTLIPEDGAGNVNVTIGRQPNVGKVLQIQEYIVPSLNDNYVTISSGTQWDTPISITVTPTSTNSKFYIDVDCQFRISGAYGMTVGVKRDGVKIPGNYNRNAQMFIYKDETLNHHYNPRVSASIKNTTLSPTTFTVWYEPFNGVGEFNYGWGRNAIRVMEVAN